MQPALYRRLSELIDRSRVERNVAKATWTRRLFEALDWGDRAAFSIQKEEGGGFHLCVEKTPVVTVIHSSPGDIDKVYTAVNRAYNQDVPWVVASDFSSLGLFGSYWISFPQDITNSLAWKIDSQEFLLEAPKLNLLTPHELARNEIDQLYTAYPLRKKRLPIDVHLVEQMKGWREMALEVLSHNPGRDDSLIHRLINSLFLVRYLEDAGKQSAKLSSIIEKKDDAFISALRTILADAGSRSGYPTVTASQLSRLKTAPLRTLLSQLYGYREWGVQYDFSAMSVDILGRFYEEYLRYKPETRVVPRQSESLYLFDQPSVELKNVRRDRGIYYTPRFVVHYIVSNLIRRFEASMPEHPPLVVDFACGSGTFLVSAIDEMQQRVRWKSRAAKCVVGFDVDERAVEAARLNLTAKCIADRLTMPLPSFNLHVNDMLDKGPQSTSILSALPDGYADIVVGNPPYINYESLIKAYSPELLKSHFEIFSKRTDSYMLFVEAALKVLRPGGFGGLVLPNAFLRSASGSQLRSLLTSHSDVLEVVDFQDQPVFQHVGIYVCILLFKKRIVGQPSTKVAVAKIYSLSNTPNTQLAKLSVSVERIEDGGESFQVDQPQGTSSWVLRNSTESRLLATIDKASVKLKDAGIELRQGIKSGEDSVFVIESGPGTTGASGPGRMIEPEILVPLLRAREMRRWYARTKAWLLFPYDRTSEELLPWTVIQKKYPHCAAYLQQHKPLLAGRKSLGKSPWYSLIRPRTSAVYEVKPKLFIAELTLRPSVCAHDNVNAAIAGSTGGGSWIIINSEAYSASSLMAYMNSAVAEWFVRQVSSLRKGGWLLIEQQTLNNLPIPAFLADKSSFARSELERISNVLQRITKESSGVQDSSLRREISGFEEQIDSLVIGALGLTAEDGAYIRSRVVGLRGAGSAKQSESLIF